MKGKEINKNKIFNKLTIWDKIFGNRVYKIYGNVYQILTEMKTVIGFTIVINLMNLFSSATISEKIKFLKLNWIALLGISFIIFYNFYFYSKRRLLVNFYKKENEVTVEDLLSSLELFFYPKKYKKIFKEVIENEFSKEKLKTYLEDKSLGLEDIYYKIIEDENIQNKILEKI